MVSLCATSPDFFSRDPLFPTIIDCTRAERESSAVVHAGGLDQRTRPVQIDAPQGTHPHFDKRESRDGRDNGATKFSDGSSSFSPKSRVSTTYSDRDFRRSVPAIASLGFSGRSISDSPILPGDLYHLPRFRKPQPHASFLNLLYTECLLSA